MSQVAIQRGAPTREASETNALRFPLLLRATHWLNAVSFVGLVVSGVGILLAHPRFYWGETGGLGTPSLFDLPLPFMLGGPSGWGRYMHFQSAWLCVLTGALYVIWGVTSSHFIRNLWPAKDQFAWSVLRADVVKRLRFEKPAEDDAFRYNLLQRLSYLAVVFVLFPLMLWTGLAMSPAITSVFPFFVTSSAGFESARTIHFFAANLLVLFVLMHVAMVALAGFVSRTMAMITGRVGRGRLL
jgi:thiosulfate reductase cytochrome b subunit